MSEKYSAVMQLGRHSDVLLLRDNSSGYLLVRRIVNKKQAEIYQILKNTSDPHIPVIHSIIGVEDGKYEVLEEYIQGRTLEEILQESECIPEPTAVLYIVQLCDVLDKIHKAKLVHRDIKPSNIIITPNNQLYLIDFDIARTRKAEGDSDTEILGTQGFAAPEQFGFHQTGAQADIYSTGILLNILLTGKMPNERLPEGYIAHVVQQCIQMDTAKRYKSAKVLKKVLCPYLPQEHPQAPKILRHIPGFRTFKVWKMVIAGIFYAYYLLSVLIAVPIIIYIGRTEEIFYLIINGLVFGTLFFFIFDVFKIRSRIRWLEKSRGRWFYPIKCILWAFLGVIVGLFIGSWLIDTILNLVKLYGGSIHE